MNQKTIRWKQRFANFEKAYQVLERTAAIENPSEAERGGLIQYFEVAFELAWKTLKDYLESEGFDTKSPRQAIKQGFQSEILEDGHIWMQALDDRNMTTHTYNEEIAAKLTGTIREKYFPAISLLHQALKSRL